MAIYFLTPWAREFFLALCFGWKLTFWLPGLEDSSWLFLKWEFVLTPMDNFFPWVFVNSVRSFLVLLLLWELLNWLKLPSQTCGLYVMLTLLSCGHGFAKDHMVLQCLLWETEDLPNLVPLRPFPSIASAPFITFISLSSFESFNLFPFSPYLLHLLSLNVVLPVPVRTLKGLGGPQKQLHEVEKKRQLETDWMFSPLGLWRPPDRCSVCPQSLT